MMYAFSGYELDTDTGELRSEEGVIPVEPQVFALLRHLIENRERLVSKDELVEHIWGGRFVSDAAIASRIKSARRAVGDDGVTQGVIRTVHKRGLRFTATVETNTAPRAVAAAATLEESARPCPETSRPSIAVVPFTLVGVAGPYAAIADALPHDLIVELSRLHWLFVIARGSSFQFRGAAATVDRIRAALNVRYCLSGTVEVVGDRVAVTVELCDTNDGGVVWSETYRSNIGAVHDIRAEIAHAVVSALELQIPLNEARRALNSPQNLDAWSAYHLGLHHMYRFDQEGNQRAIAYFERAVAMEPGFARAYAGLSFAHFENAFLSFIPDRAAATALAQRNAVLSLEQDPLDPFGNLVMGRASWLQGDLESSLPWLNRAVELNPNYAQGTYSLAWTQTLLGQANHGQALTDTARGLSPLDPLLYGMLGVRALSHIVLDQPAEAALWGEQAARSPRAHALIELIAAVAHGMNNDDARADAWVKSARARHPGLSADDFLSAFPFYDRSMRQRRSPRGLDRLIQ